MLQEELSAWAQPEVTFKPPLEGKIMLLDNMKHTKRTKQTKKKVNAAYIRLMRYFMNI